MTEGASTPKLGVGCVEALVKGVLMRLILNGGPTINHREDSLSPTSAAHH